MCLGAGQEPTPLQKSDATPERFRDNFSESRLQPQLFATSMPLAGVLLSFGDQPFSAFFGAACGLLLGAILVLGFVCLFGFAAFASLLARLSRFGFLLRGGVLNRKEVLDRGWG